MGGINTSGSRLLRYLLMEVAETASKTDEQLQSFNGQLVKRLT